MKPLSKRIDVRHKNNKFLYYAKVLAWQLVPSSFYRSKLAKKLGGLNTLPENAQTTIRFRVNYYNKLSTVTSLSPTAVALRKFSLPKKQKAYYFDTQEYTRYFNTNYSANFLFGDITKVPAEPSLVKSRPISGDNTNSVILNLDKLRHFNFIQDDRSFENKKNMLVGRGVVKREHRIRFYDMYFNHPLCNLGQINRGKNEHWIREFLTIDEHLDYKFILCLEGNDVATNLKWVMSSNSLAVMPKPKFETWFMEGTLVGNKHYVEIKDDYSDLEERLTYYIDHPAEALQIIQHAHDYIDQFKHSKQEDLISLLVLEKYFYKTGQCSPTDRRFFDSK
jgi:hypothetical protein